MKRRNAWVVVTRTTYKCNNFVGPWRVAKVFDHRDEATVYARNCTKQVPSNARSLDAKVLSWYGKREDFWSEMLVSQARKAGFIVQTN